MPKIIADRPQRVWAATGQAGRVVEIMTEEGDGKFSARISAEEAEALKDHPFDIVPDRPAGDRAKPAPPPEAVKEA